MSSHSQTTAASSSPSKPVTIRKASSSSPPARTSACSSFRLSSLASCKWQTWVSPTTARRSIRASFKRTSMTLPASRSITTRTALATASTEGTLIRVFEINPKGEIKNLCELRRGVEQAFFYSINFSRDGSYICASSNKGHRARLQLAGPAVQPPNEARHWLQHQHHRRAVRHVLLSHTL